MFYYAIIGLVGFGILGWIVSIHNNLVQVRNNADKNWINIDVVLLQRNEELGKLIDTCKGYMAHEAGLLAKLTEMRSRYGAEKSLVQKAATENDIQGAMSKLQQVWEAYPDLRATENFQQVQRRISALESTIADRRELFNDSVNIFNNPHRNPSRSARCQNVGLPSQALPRGPLRSQSRPKNGL